MSVLREKQKDEILNVTNMFYNYRIYILAYHSVDDCQYKHSVSVKEFERQMIYIKKKFLTLSLEEFIAVVNKKKRLDKDAILVTFDDGIQDNLTNAYPILKKYNIPAIIFLSTFFVAKIHGGGVHKFQFLTWEEMKELESNGLVKIENHTHSHPILTSLNAVEMEKELNISNKLIEQYLQKTCRALAYPKGEYDNDVIGVVEKWFSLAFTTSGGFVDVDNFHMYKIPRILVSKEVSLTKFKLLLTTQFWLLKKIRSLIERS